MTSDESSRDAPQLPGLILLRQIGGGTYGEVWLARESDGEEGAFRAVKLVRRDRFEDAHPYEREWRGQQRFESLSRSHVGIVDVLRLERDDAHGLFFSVMELADDADVDATEVNPKTYEPRTLQGQLAAHGALPPAECLKVGVSLARALAHLHRHELVHRDVKPSNIIYVGGKPKLVDIGLVARIDSTPSAVGTFGYIPYEGPGKTTADVFALGKVLYEMATGKDRYDFPELPAPNPELRSLNAVILKACADLPKERYPNAVEMAEDLERVRDGHRPLDESTAIFNKLLATLAVLFVGALAWSQWGDKPNAPETLEPSWRDGLEAHWPMDGHARDATDHGYDGNATGVTPATDRFGRADRALHFDGNASIDIGDRLDIHTNDFTVSLWVKTKDDSFGLVSKMTEWRMPSRWGLVAYHEYEQHRNLLLVLMQSTGSDGNAGVVYLGLRDIGLNNGKWHQLVAVFDRDKTLNVFLDGKLLTQADISKSKTVDFDSDYHLFLGAANGEGNAEVHPRKQLTGDMDDVRIWRRALSKAEVVQMYRDESAPNTRPAARWDFDYSYSHVLETDAMKYIIKTNNVRPFIEWQKTPLTYWGPITNGVVGEIVYHFPFARPVRRAHLRCTVNTWDFSGSTAGIGRGAAAIGISTNGTDWIALRNGLEPEPLWSTDGFVNDELPMALMGATNYFIRVRMLKEGATDLDYTPAQHSRMSKLPGDKGFEFKAELGRE
jgi:serine/threonine protein kinase